MFLPWKPTSVPSVTGLDAHFSVPSDLQQVEASFPLPQARVGAAWALQALHTVGCGRAAPVPSAEQCGDGTELLVLFKQAMKVYLRFMKGLGSVTYLSFFKWLLISTSNFLMYKADCFAAISCSSHCGPNSCFNTSARGLFSSSAGCCHRLLSFRRAIQPGWVSEGVQRPIPVLSAPLLAAAEAEPASVHVGSKLHTPSKLWFRSA